jgi:glycosyltransferase involved in cell wall biosynthesis
LKLDLPQHRDTALRDRFFVNPTSEGYLHVLIFEPRVEGHHVGYLKFVTEDLLAVGHRLTLAIDTRPEPMHRIRAQMADLLDRVTVISVRDDSGRLVGGGKINSIASSLMQSGADIVFLNSFDEIASWMLRRAAIGIMPPATLRGRLGGIYLRPRFLGSCGFSPNLWTKAIGFRRLLRGGWFSHLLLLDPYLHAAFKTREPSAPVFFLPDAYPADFVADRNESRRQLGLSTDKRVFLFYGGAYRRKGLHLAVEAMLALPQSESAFLLCAGQLINDSAVARGLSELVAQNRALVINRYVSAAEEKQLFAASDAVLLPYHKHYGSSGVLARAVGASLPVIVSDEELLGRLVREHGLGVLFRSGDANALSGVIQETARASPAQMGRWQAAARAWAPSCSREAFRDAVIGAFARVGKISEI